MTRLLTNLAALAAGLIIGAWLSHQAKSISDNLVRSQGFTLSGCLPDQPCANETTP